MGTPALRSRGVGVGRAPRPARRSCAAVSSAVRRTSSGLPPQRAEAHTMSTGCRPRAPRLAHAPRIRPGRRPARGWSSATHAPAGGSAAPRGHQRRLESRRGRRPPQGRLAEQKAAQGRAGASGADLPPRAAHLTSRPGQRDSAAHAIARLSVPSRNRRIRPCATSRIAQRGGQRHRRASGQAGKVR